MALLDRPGAKLPEGAIVAVKLTPVDLQGLSKKLAPRYSGPWVTLRTFDNGVTYSVVNSESNDVRQVPISQMKVLQRPPGRSSLDGSRLGPVNRYRPRFKLQLRLLELVVHGCRR